MQIVYDRRVSPDELMVLAQGDSGRASAILKNRLIIRFSGDAPTHKFFWALNAIEDWLAENCADLYVIDHPTASEDPRQWRIGFANDGDMLACTMRWQNTDEMRIEGSR